MTSGVLGGNSVKKKVAFVDACSRGDGMFGSWRFSLRLRVRGTVAVCHGHAPLASRQGCLARPTVDGGRCQPLQVPGGGIKRTFNVKLCDGETSQVPL